MLNNINDILEIKNLNMRFGGIKALSKIDIQIPKNQITSIIGPNGAGKTTLFNCITGFYVPQTGVINLTVDNQSLNLNLLLGEEITLKDFLNPNYLAHKIYYKIFGGAHLLNRAGIARTFQNIRLFNNMTVIENLLVAQHIKVNKNIFSGLFNLRSYQTSEQAALDHAMDWLNICGLTRYANVIAGSLPYGHQRLLEIARAMCTNPKIICLDEPAAGLNHQETEVLDALIRDLKTKHHMTVLLIEHDINLVMNISEKIYVLDHGQVIACGTPTEIRKNPVVIAAYLGG